ncbi:PLC-like phosphodiesterase [Fusarium austroafricanum]|uniref:PLC-like phosphodiesterase n=1 Tax=Fusarium austroafricanum TaxID=2364996 RepID=A0A8H4KJU3_9HYPO|nr:PLC-like phosphodiesterase [Fusarium austroafricanum]
MAPAHSSSWMQTHRDAFGSRPLYKLCIPNSHDAGTYRLDYGTSGGGKGPVLTQTKSILEQLNIGVRRFDIRPTFANRPGTAEFSWHCGHYTGEAADKIGWQGGSCASIQEVVNQVNEFTKDNAELIILDISHTYAINISNPISSTSRDVNPDEWASLFSTLKGINCLFTVDRVGGDHGKPLQDYLLDEFIGNGKAAVIVPVDEYSNRQELIRHGFWPVHTLEGKPYLSLGGTSVTHTQNNSEAIWSVLLPSGADSVLNLAAKEQQERFPWLLQQLASESLSASSITMDRIENADLLTFCLAVSYYRYYQETGRSEQPVVVYGAALITNANAQEQIQAAIQQGRSISADNQLLTDTWEGIHKSCAVLYSHGGLVKGRWAREGSQLHFGQDVMSVTYGNKEVMNAKLYYRLLKLIEERGTVRVTNQEIVGGDQNDPLVGTRKTCVVVYRRRGAAEKEERHALEFDNMSF